MPNNTMERARNNYGGCYLWPCQNNSINIISDKLSFVILVNIIKHSNGLKIRLLQPVKQITGDQEWCPSVNSKSKREQQHLVSPSNVLESHWYNLICLVSLIIMFLFRCCFSGSTRERVFIHNRCPDFLASIFHHIMRGPL